MQSDNKHQKHKNMKKTLLLFFGLWATVGITNAQDVSMDFIEFYNPGYDIFQFDNKVMQQSNGDLVTNLSVYLPSGPGYGDPPVLVGNVFHKVSPFDVQITDTLFVADSVAPFYHFFKNPVNGGNLCVNIEPDSNGGSALRIAHFSDDNLQINHDDDLVVHLHDSAAFDQPDDMIIDSQNDLIVKYYTNGADANLICHVSRYGLDGTLKHSNTLPVYLNYMNTFTEFDSQPRQYYQWKDNEDGNLLIYVLDSLFQVKNYYVVNKLLEFIFYDDPYFSEVLEEFRFGTKNTSVIFNGGDLLVAAPYIKDSSWVYDYQERGLAVVRYDLRTMQRKNLVHFNDWPGPETDARCFCFRKSWDGNLYLVYWENATMTAVKTDSQLNMAWKRYCYEPGTLKADPFVACSSDMLLDAEGGETGVYVAGYSYRAVDNKEGVFYFFLNEEGLASAEEKPIAVRPYAFYPNPARNELYLQYSPDVQPARIELYDLQGRLVQTQTHGLESLRLDGLAAGQYLMKVILEDGKAFTDKVVKE